MRALLSWGPAAVIVGLAVAAGLVWMGRPEAPQRETTASPVSAASTLIPLGNSPALPFSDFSEPASTGEFSPEEDEFSWLEDLESLAKRDPAAAVRTLGSISPGENRTLALRAVFRQWASVAPRDALSGLDVLASDRDRDEAREFVCHRVAEDDPRLAFSLALESGAKISTPLLRELLQQWSAREALDAQAWALALPAGPDRDQLLVSVSHSLAQSDPVAAGALVAEQLPPGPLQDEAAVIVLHQWALRDIDGAAQWVARFPAGPLRKRAEEELEGIRAHRPGD